MHMLPDKRPTVEQPPEGRKHVVGVQNGWIGFLDLSPTYKGVESNKAWWFSAYGKPADEGRHVKPKLE